MEKKLGSGEIVGGEKEKNLERESDNYKTHKTLFNYKKKKKSTNLKSNR